MRHVLLLCVTCVLITGVCAQSEEDFSHESQLQSDNGRFGGDVSVDFDAESQEGNQGGPPLDVDNKLKDVKNKGKSPNHKPVDDDVRKGRLVNRFHWMLEINDFSVTVTMNGDDPKSQVILKSVGRGLVSIRGVKANRFLCMNNSTGKMFVSPSLKKQCIFREFQAENFHTAYRLHSKNSPWYIGISRKGKYLKKASKRYDFGTLFQLIT